MPVTPLRPSDPATVGPHRLLGRVGQGGVGTVYLAVSPDERAVAVKVLREPVGGDADARRRFRHELDALRRVRGPHLVEVLDADVEADLPYLVTRFVPGRRLDELVTEDGPLDGPALARLGRGIADALTTVHAAGVVHRDLTPGNVLVLDGSPQVIDLGLAIAADVTALTRTGLIVGTPGYLAPEQVTGREVTAAVDVHAWGATVAFAGTGRPPYGTGRPEAVLYRIVHEEPDVDGLPHPLAGLVEAAMSRDPSRRPTAAQLLDALGGPSRDAPVSVHLPRDVEATTVLAVGALHPTVALTRQDAPGLVPAGLAPDLSRVEHGIAGAPYEEVGHHDGTGADDPPYADRPYDDRAQDRPYDHRAHDDRPYDDGPYDEGRGRDRDVVPWDDPDALPVRTSPVRSAQVLLTTAAALAVVTTGALVAPVLTAALTLVFVVVLRAAGRSAERLALRRERRGERRRDPVVSALGLPWHLLAALADTAVALPLMALVAAVPAGLIWLVDPVVNGLERPELAAASALLVALLVCLSRRAHRRTRIALRSALLTATPSTAAGVAVPAALAISALLLLATAEGSAPTWWPLTGV